MRRSATQVFALPALLAVAGFGALVVGLLGGGWFDLLCWLGLAAPVAVIAWAWARRTRR